MRLQNLIVHSAEHMPNALAIKDSACSMTYRELDSLSNRIARALVKLGVQFGDRVGIWLNKSAYAVAAMQGVLRLGAVYVPLDPLSPTSRIRSILNDCSIQAIVTTEKRAEAVLTDNLAQIKCLCVNGTWQELSWHNLLTLSDEPIEASKSATNEMAYILYTSGSTGKPKGVCVSHRNALAFINWAAVELQATSADRFSNHASFHFDISVLDLYAAFQVGASVHLIPDEVSYVAQKLVNFIVEDKITIWYSVPSALILMMEQGGLLDLAFTSVRAILFAGEPFPIKHLRKLHQHYPHTRLLNLYGPTETNVCTFYEIKKIEPERIQPMPIGCACSGNRVWAVKEDGTEVKPGEKGELIVHGPTVMLGYWGQLAHNNKPYATGDIVQLQQDGNYIYIGRRDSMVKIRGLRVELGEIESVLGEHPAIYEVAVIAVGAGMEARLFAFISVNKDATAPSLLDIKQYCAKRLPRYMIVDDISYLSELPRTRNGKIDRLQLSNYGTNLTNNERNLNAAL